MTADKQPPEWLITRHGEAWDLRAFMVEPGVAAWRWQRLPDCRVGSRMATAPTWPELGRILDQEQEFDQKCERRIESCRTWRGASARA